MPESAKITRYQHVQEILDQACGDAQPGHFGEGRFWDKPLQEFMQVGRIWLAWMSSLLLVLTEGQGLA